MSKLIAVPSFDELMWPAINALKAMGGSGNNEELLAKIIEKEAVPSDIQAVPHSDGRQTKLSYNLAWAKTYLKKVGAFENSSRGVWSITKQGEQLTVDDVRSIPARVRKQVVKDKLTKYVAPALEDLATGLDKEDIEETDPHWKDQLLDILRSLKPDAFERNVHAGCKAGGYEGWCPCNRFDRW